MFNRLIKKTKILLTAFLLIPIIANATEIHDVQSWYTFIAIGDFPKEKSTPSKFRYWLEGQEFLGDHNSRTTQALYRPGIGYTLNENTSIWLGYALLYTGIPQATNPFVEKRIWQQLLWIKKYPQLTFLFRTRLVQRFIDNNPHTVWRLRQTLKFISPIATMPKWNFVGSNDVFWNFNNFLGENNQGFDQNRLFMGLGYTFNKTLNVEAGYLNQFVRANTDIWANNIAVNVFLTL